MQGHHLVPPIVHLNPQVGQERQLGTNVLQRRHPPKGQGRLRQQARREDGKGRIFSAGYGHGPDEGDPAGNDELIHGGG